MFGRNLINSKKTSNMVKSKVWILKTKYQGKPKLSDFEMIEENIPDILEKGEVLCEVLHLTVDPYMRIHGFDGIVGQPLFGENIANVVASENKDYPVGTILRTYFGWRTHIHLKDLTKVPSPLGLPMFDKLPDMEGIPFSVALGTLGMPGWTAYFGLLDVCQPNEGETMLINSAAGAVGCVVGQMAKIKGCRVIGFAGTDDKCDWLKSLGFDEVFNYKIVNLDETLKKVAPDGIDCYFDNVGGDFTDTVMNHMKSLGRVAICGQISTYLSIEAPRIPSPYLSVLLKQLTIQGFVFTHYEKRYPEAHEHLVKWIKEGKIKYKESVTKGFENMPQAFIGLFDGSNFGKAIVNV